MTATSLVYYQEKLLKTQARKLTFHWSVASGAPTLLVAGAPILVTQAAISAQATIDSFLGTTSEFDYLAFDATSMGTDAIGFIIDMKGQARTAVWTELKVFTSTNGVTQAGSRAAGGTMAATTLGAGLLCGASASVTGSGNLACRHVIGSLDSADGTLELSVYWIAK